MKIEKQWCGRIDFATGLDLQRQSHASVCSENKIILLGCEHNPVITLGKRSVESEDILDPTMAPISRVDRGGHATLHSPGQLVVYPIVPIARLKWRLKDFVRDLVNVCLQTVSDQGVDCHANASEPGIYTSTGKIGFIGVRVKAGVSGHGISININNDLDMFRAIRSCGVSDESLDRLNKYNSKLETESLFYHWCERFSQLDQSRVEVPNHL